MFYKLNKKKKRVSPLSFKLPASNAITTPTLAQVIGQFGFNMQEILSTFNKKSIIYSKGIKVTTLLFLMPNKKWKLNLLLPTHTQIIKMISDVVKYSKIPNILYFWKRKFYRLIEKYRFKLKKRKHWRGKITLRHLYEMNLQLISITNSITIDRQLYNTLKSILNLSRSFGIYILKPNLKAS